MQNNLGPSGRRRVPLRGLAVAVAGLPAVAACGRASGCLLRRVGLLKSNDALAACFVHDAVDPLLDVLLHVMQNLGICAQKYPQLMSESINGIFHSDF